MNKLLITLIIFCTISAANAQRQNSRKTQTQSTNNSGTQQSKQCKILFFSCPPTHGIICNNSKIYNELETSQGLDGIYVKDDRGCWRLSGNNQVPETKINLIQRLRTLFGRNSIY